MPETTVNYVPSPGFRTAFIDNVVSVGVADALGARIQVSFMRMDVVPIGEKAQQDASGNISFLPNVIPNVRQQKTVEFAIDMRPDTALAVINNIITALRQLPLERQARYGIPQNLQLFEFEKPR